MTELSDYVIIVQQRVAAIGAKINEAATIAAVASKEAASIGAELWARAQPILDKMPEGSQREAFQTAINNLAAVLAKLAATKINIGAQTKEQP
jgi:hypothetical protein